MPVPSSNTKRDLLVAPVCEAALILVVALAGWASHQPLMFASVGPTAYELVETPHRPSARPYNVVVGHLIAVLAGFASLWLTRAWWAAPITASGVPWSRVWACGLAALLTVLGTLLVRANQPAALSTTLLIAAGVMQTVRDGFLILCAVVLIMLLGEPVRRWRLARREEAGDSS